MYREHDTTRAPKRRRTRTPNTPLDSHLWRDNLSRVLAPTGDMRAWAPASATQHCLQTCACVAASVIAQHHRSQPPTPRPFEVLCGALMPPQATVFFQRVCTCLPKEAVGWGSLIINPQHTRTATPRLPSGDAVSGRRLRDVLS